MRLQHVRVYFYETKDLESDIIYSSNISLPTITIVMAEKYRLDDEVINYCRLCQLYVDFFRDIYWELLKTYIPVSDLVKEIQKFLSTTRIGASHTPANYYHQLTYIVQKQSDPENTDFDLSLLYYTIKNVCKQFPAPSQGWHKDPTNNDISVSDDVIRIRLGRNRLIGHSKQASVSNKEYLAEVQAIRDIVSRLEINLHMNFSKDLDSILENPFEPETLRTSLKFISDLADQLRRDETINIKLEGLGRDIENLHSEFLGLGSEILKKEEQLFAGLEELGKTNLQSSDVSVGVQCMISTEVPKVEWGPQIVIDIQEYKKMETHEGSFVKWQQCIEMNDVAMLESMLKDGYKPNQRVLGSASEKLGFDSEIVQILCRHICMSIKEHFHDGSHVWVGYRPEWPAHHVFVISHRGKKSTPPKSLPLPLLSFDMLFREADKCSIEGKEVLYSKECREKPFNDDERKMIRKCIKHHSVLLMEKHSNLNMISACSVRSTNYGTNKHKKEKETCIIMYVHVKGVVPLGEKKFPTFLEVDGIRFPTDVREGYYRSLRGQAATEYHNDLKMGCQISSNIKNYSYGTLGAFVEINDNTGQHLGCITSAHVLYPDQSLQDSEEHEDESLDVERVYVYQPADRFLDNVTEPFGEVIGKVFTKGQQGITGIDVALVKITDDTRVPKYGCFPAGNYEETGFSASRPMMFTSGKILTNVPDDSSRFVSVFKFGCVTGLTKGSFYLNGCVVRRNTLCEQEMDFGYELHDQIEVLSTGKIHFANYGDSGALVLALPKNNDMNNLNAVGILQGGTSADTYLVTPIWDVLGALNLPLKLKQFPVDPRFVNTICNRERGAETEETTNEPSNESRIQKIEMDVENLKKQMIKDNQEIKQLLQNLNSNTTGASKMTCCLL